MISEDLEFQISQYADGTLAVSNRQQVEDLLRTDAQAQAMLGQYRRLDLHLSQLKDAPAVHWNRLAEHLSGVIDDASAPSVAGQIGVGRSGVGRIGFLQSSAWQSRWRVAAAVLVAASALLVTRQAVHIHQTHVVPQPVPVIDVKGPEVEIATGPAVQDVAVGPSPSLAPHTAEARYGEGVIVPRPAKVVIVGVNPPANGDSHVH